MDLLVVGIDPGIKGYFVSLNESGNIEDRFPMPLTGKKIDPYGIWRLLKFFRLRAAEQGRKLIFGLEKVFTLPSDKKSSELIRELRSETDVVKQNGIIDELEEVLKKGDGRVGVLSYGIGYGYLLMGIAVTGCRVEVFHPSSWQKVMHRGCDKGLNAKERSLQVAQRLWEPDQLFPEDRGRLKKSPDGLIDAACIAEATRLKVVGA